MVKYWVYKDTIGPKVHFISEDVTQEKYPAPDHERGPPKSVNLMISHATGYRHLSLTWQQPRSAINIMSYLTFWDHILQADPRHGQPDQSHK